MIIKRLVVFVGLSWQEKWVLLMSIMLLPLTAFLLNIAGFGRTQKLFFLAGTDRLATDSGSQQQDKAIATAHMIAIAARLWGDGMDCLKKSLVLCLLLKLQGIKAELRVGVQKHAGKFNAHAWVEFNGQVLMDKKQNLQGFSTIL